LKIVKRESSLFTLQKIPERLTRKQHRVIPPHHLNRNLPPQKIDPAIRKFFALLRLDRLNCAGIALKKNTRMIFPRLQREPAAVFAQASVSLDKILFTQAQEGRETGHLRISQSHFTRPAATSGATLTWQIDFHLPRRHTNLAASSGQHLAYQRHVDRPTRGGKKQAPEPANCRWRKDPIYRQPPRGYDSYRMGCAFAPSRCLSRPFPLRVKPFGCILHSSRYSEY
jgi:hypothetical protein